MGRSIRTVNKIESKLNYYRKASKGLAFATLGFLSLSLSLSLS